MATQQALLVHWHHSDQHCFLYHIRSCCVSNLHRRYGSFLQRGVLWQPRLGGRCQAKQLLINNVDLQRVKNVSEQKEAASTIQPRHLYRAADCWTSWSHAADSYLLGELQGWPWCWPSRQLKGILGRSYRPSSVRHNANYTLMVAMYWCDNVSVCCPLSDQKINSCRFNGYYTSHLPTSH